MTIYDNRKIVYFDVANENLKKLHGRFAFQTW